MSMERRVAIAHLELRADDTQVRLVGYASRFNTPYAVGAFTETVAPGAFTATLAAKPDVRLLIDHEGQPLARTKSGTLRLTQDSIGLKVESTLDATDPDVQRLIPKMRRGDLDQMSFAFRIAPGGDEWNSDYTLRTIRSANLDGGDVSVVTYPASPTTSVQLEMLSARRAAAAKAAPATRTISLAQALRISRSLNRR
jgi:HK97 family phage prohead protease